MGTFEYKKQIREVFSNQLRRVLIERGKKSPHSILGADANFLAEIAGCSVTMARRYLQGKGVPEEAILNKIAKWAKVEPAWLLYGESQNAQVESLPLDKKLWVEIFNYLRPHLIDNKLNKERFEKLINFSIDIYENVYLLDIPFEEKSKIISLMAQSIEFGMDEKS